MPDYETIDFQMDFMLHLLSEQLRDRFHYKVFYRIHDLKDAVHEQVDTLDVVISQMGEETSR